MNFKKQRTKFGVLNLVIILALGVVFFVAGSSTFNDTRVEQGWQQVSGTVSNVTSSKSSRGGIHYRPIVTYQVNGKSYTTVSKTRSSIFPEIGSARTVAYNPLHPEEAKVVGEVAATIMMVVFSVLGVVFVGAGIFSFLHSSHRTREIERLKTEGRKIKGLVTEVRKLGHFGKTPTYTIYAAAEGQDGQVKNYKSDRIMHAADLTFRDLSQEPLTVDIFIDPAQPDKYYVDIDGLPELDTDVLRSLLKRS